MRRSIGLGFERTRALCVAAMVIFHSLVWLSPYEKWINERHESYYTWVSLGFLLGVFALMLPACAGFSLRIFIERNRREPHLWLRVFSLCSVLLVAHAMMQYLTWGKAAIFTWEALPFIALSYALTFSLFLIGGERLVSLLAILAVPATPTIRNIFSENSWLREILVGNQNPSGVWPFFPWYFLVASGFLAAGRLKAVKAQKLTLLVAALTILVFSQAGNGTKELGTFSLWASHPFQTSPLNVVALAGGFVALVLLLSLFPATSLNLDSALVAPIGRSVLVIYVSHVVLGVFIFKDWQQSDQRLLVLLGGPLLLLLSSWSIGFWFQKLVRRRLVFTFSRKTVLRDA